MQDGDVAVRARAWLLAAQQADGSWPVMPPLPTPNWTTGLGVLALANDERGRTAAVRGARWLLDARGSVPQVRTFMSWLLGRDSPVAEDTTLVGWPWVDGTYSWVEPTSYAVLALEAMRGAVPADAVARRVDEARRMLVNRRCPGGGWNYGNARVLGIDLWPYPDTTSLALLALRGGGIESTESVAALERMLTDNQSGLATALGLVALGAYGRDVSTLRERLAARFAATAFRGDVRSLAWAILALDGEASTFVGGRRA